MHKRVTPHNSWGGVLWSMPFGMTKLYISSFLRLELSSSRPIGTDGIL
jgi:hypothetical protein